MGEKDGDLDGTLIRRDFILLEIWTMMIIIVIIGLFTFCKNISLPIMVQRSHMLLVLSTYAYRV